MTDFCYDTEFLDDGTTIELISIGIVGDRLGEEYYAVNADCDFARVREHDWLWANVVPHLPTTKSDWTDPQHARLITTLDMSAACVKPKWVIANEVRDFIVTKTDGDTKLWAYYGAYDHVALAQLFGPMCDMPLGLPYWTHDLMQEMERFPKAPRPAKPSNQHNALEDARWNLQVLQALRAAEAGR